MFGFVRKSKLVAAEKAAREADELREAAQIEVCEVSGANGRLAATIGAFRAVLTDHLTETLRHDDRTVRLLAASLLSELDFADLNLGPEVRVAPKAGAS